MIGSEFVLNFKTYKNRVLKFKRKMKF